MWQADAVLALSFGSVHQVINEHEQVFAVIRMVREDACPDRTGNAYQTAFLGLKAEGLQAM